MKLRLKELYIKNHRSFQVWEYLWLFSDTNNSIEFTHSDLRGRFNIPETSLCRILEQAHEWNDERIIVEKIKIKPKTYRIVFHPRGRRNAKVITVHDELYVWVRKYYESQEYEYNDLAKHRRYVKIICDKLVEAIKKRGAEVTDDLLKQAFYAYFNNIDDWWRNNSFTLPAINKHFTKILNQVKQSVNGKKRDSYSKATESAEQVDFGKLARNK
jgi:hypothetical protein